MALTVDVTAPFASLPLDLVSLILGLAPPRPRRKALSLVCKRWRAAVLRSLSCLSLSQHCPPGIDVGDVLLRQLPRLTELSVLHLPPHTVTLPTTVTKLNLHLTEGEQTGSVIFGAHVADLCAAAYDDVNLLITYLRPSLPCLARLSLSLAWEPEMLHFLADARFAALSGLRLRSTAPLLSVAANQLAVSFLRNHSTQLTSFAVLGISGLWADELTQLPYPELLDLEYRTTDDLSPSLLCALVSNAPRLCNLSLSDCNNSASFLRARATCLTELHNTHLSIDWRRTETQFPRLRLAWPSNAALYAPLSAVYPALAARLAVLAYDTDLSPATVWRALGERKNPQVRNLSLMHALPPEPPAVRLPHLAQLTVYAHPTARGNTVRQSIDAARHLLRCCPSAHRLCIAVAKALSIGEEDIADLRLLLEDLRRQGQCSRVDIVCGSPATLWPLEEIGAECGWLDVRISDAPPPCEAP